MPEWHSSVVGFYAGFAFGASDWDSVVARAAVLGVFGPEDRTGHIAQARTEAAYAGACFVVGAVAGRAYANVRNA